MVLVTRSSNGFPSLYLRLVTEQCAARTDCSTHGMYRLSIRAFTACSYASPADTTPVREALASHVLANVSLSQQDFSALRTF